MRTIPCRLIVTLVLVLLTFGMGVAGYGGNMEIGFARVNINPPMGIPLRGQLFPYYARGIESDLYANAMCISDGKTKIMMVSCDVAGISNDMSARIYRKIEKDLGVPASNIMVCATHTHSGPATTPSRGNDLINNYCTKLEAGIIEALKQAHKNTQKGKLTVAYGKLPGIGFNRRFIMSDRTIQTHPLKLDPHIVAPEGPDAKDLFVFCAYDEDGKPMGNAINFTCHATVMERDNENVSHDYPGKLCDYVNENIGPGAISLFLQGTCGNICQVNPLDGSHKEVGLEWTKVMGRKIGRKALDLIKNDSIETAGPLRAISRKVELTLRKPDPVLAQWALNYKDVPAETPGQSYYGTDLYNEIKPPVLSLNDLFETPWWANRYARTVRSHAKNKEKTAEITVKAFAQDNWVIVSLPGEFFIEFGNAIQERSPFEKTIVVGYANGSNGYFPTRKAFSRGGGYETNIGTARLTPDAGYLIVDAAVEMLQSLSKQYVKD